MPTQLAQFNRFPEDVAISETGSFVEDGVFFLDFSRPLQRLRWFGVTNEFFGFTVALFVPVVHQGEDSGGYVAGIHRSDPYFKNILDLWKQRYPSKRQPPPERADGLKIVADFATQFPSSSQPPKRDG